MRAEPRLKSPLRRSLAVLTVAVAAGSLTAVATPASAATSGTVKRWLQVTTGYAFTCGITTTHDLYCWGDNYNGQLGTGDYRDRRLPTRIGPRGIWASVSSSYQHTCALDRNGTRYCWGSNTDGKLGYGDTTERLTPTPADSGWTMISAGMHHTCGIKTDGKAHCWGDDQFGQLGNSSERNDDQLSPAPVQFDGQWSAIHTRDRGTCGLDTGGKRYCWGDNIGSNLGLGDFSEGVPPYVTTPLARENDGTWRSVERALREGGCGVSTDRSLYCWGDNWYGEVGVGDTESHYAPAQVSGGNWAQVSRGWYHTCAVKTNGALYCWGTNTAGQLGIGTSGTSLFTTPQKVNGQWGAIPGHLKKGPVLSAGGEHTCAIRADKTLFCWGKNDLGQLGNGTLTDSSSPRKVF